MPGYCGQIFIADVCKKMRRLPESSSGKEPVRYVYMDIATEYDRFTQLLKDEKPDSLVHFANL